MTGFKVKFQHILNVSFGDFFQVMEGRRTMMGQYPSIGLFQLLAPGSADFQGLEVFVVQPSAGLRLLSWESMIESAHKKPLVFTDCFGRRCMLSYSRGSCQFVLTIRHEARTQQDVPCHPELSNKKIGAMMR